MKGKKKAPIRGRTGAKGTQGHNPLQTHTARRKVSRAPIVYHNLKGKSRGYENEYGLSHRMDGRGVVQRTRASKEGRNRAGSRHGGLRSLEQREGITMAKVIKRIGGILIAVGLIGVLGIAKTMDLDGFSFAEGAVRAAGYLIGAVIGVVLVKAGGGCDDE